MSAGHAEQARRVLGNFPHDDICDDQNALAWAQIHATLAMVEQQRIANLIAYVNRWTDGEVLDVDDHIRELLGFEGRP